jgi:hypothetical protein
VESAGGKPEPLSRSPGMAEVLTRKYTLVRYYCPEELRKELKAIAESKFGKE